MSLRDRLLNRGAYLVLWEPVTLGVWVQLLQELDAAFRSWLS
jgi:hypothetical protein